MSRLYTARRASKRWLEGAPAYVLDVLDHPKEKDRYTILFTTQFSQGERRPYCDSWIAYISLDDGLGSYWGELKAHEASMYRYREKHRRIKWGNLPAGVQRAVIARAEQ